MCLVAARPASVARFRLSSFAVASLLTLVACPAPAEEDSGDAEGSRAEMETGDAPESETGDEHEESSGASTAGSSGTSSSSTSTGSGESTSTTSTSGNSESTSMTTSTSSGGDETPATDDGASSEDTGTAETQSDDCTRELLDGLLDDYLAALSAGDPSTLPLASTLKFTENAEVVEIGSTDFWMNAGDTRYSQRV